MVSLESRKNSRCGRFGRTPPLWTRPQAGQRLGTRPRMAVDLEQSLVYWEVKTRNLRRSCSAEQEALTLLITMHELRTREQHSGRAHRARLGCCACQAEGRHNPLCSGLHDLQCRSRWSQHGENRQHHESGSRDEAAFHHHGRLEYGPKRTSSHGSSREDWG